MTFRFNSHYKKRIKKEGRSKFELMISVLLYFSSNNIQVSKALSFVINKHVHYLRAMVIRTWKWLPNYQWWCCADDYLSQECSQTFINCMNNFKNSKAPTFKGNTCDVDDVIEVIHVVMEAALLAGRVLHKP